MPYTWKDQFKVCNAIRRKCFDSKEVDPSWLKKPIIQEAKERHSCDFASVREDFFASAFKRAANEWSLETDLELSKKKNVKQSQASGDGTIEEALLEDASPLEQASGNKTLETLSKVAKVPSDSKVAAKIRKKHQEVVRLPSKISTRSTHKMLIRLPYIISKWNDGVYERLHLFIQMLAGTTAEDLVGNPKMERGVFKMQMKLNKLLLQQYRLFNHPEFQAQYRFDMNENDAKFIAYEKEVNDFMGNEVEKIFTIEIPLGDYDFTPERHSGHSPYLPISLPEEDADGNTTEEKAFIFFFDLMVKNKTESFTTKAKRKKKKSPTRRTMG